MATFHCSVVTPERVALETEARFAAFPAHDGEIGVLPGRAPLLVKLGVGRLRVETAEGAQVFLVDGGFAEMAENRLTVLTESARRPEQVDRAEAEQHLTAARAMRIDDDASFEARQHALALAQAELRIAR
jgi:F-type H+-transporting ATPase subunit epsilon